MNGKKTNRIFKAVVPAFLLTVSVGQIYAFTNVATAIAESIGQTQQAVQFAFSLGIFFLGTGAAFFGKIVEHNIRLSTAIGAALFLSGLAVTALGIEAKSLGLIYLGFGALVGTGTGIIYISPVKTMMLWFPNAKAIAAAFPIISFGLGSTLSTMLYKGFGICGAVFAGFERHGPSKAFMLYAAFYAILTVSASLMLEKPKGAEAALRADGRGFAYAGLFKDAYFLRAWLFMFLNISCGLCLIPLAKQVMKTPAVGYPESAATLVVALSGLMNGGGRFLFAWWSERLAKRADILLFILGISAGIMALSFWPPFIGLALLAINACYGAGFSVIPSILSDHYGMADISKIHGAVLSAWGAAGLVGNQAALFVHDRLGWGYTGVVAMLALFYSLNFLNALSLNRRTLKNQKSQSIKT